MESLSISRVYEIYKNAYSDFSVRLWLFGIVKNRNSNPPFLHIHFAMGAHHKMGTLQPGLKDSLL